MEAQNAVTFGYLEQIGERDAIRRRLTELWDRAKAWAPVKRGGRYFQLRNSGLQNQDVLYVQEIPGGEPRRPLADLARVRRGLRSGPARSDRVE